MRTRLAAARGREVAACRDTATIDGRAVVLVEFARQAEMLASLCLFGPEGVVFHDYPAAMDEQRVSCWRVDDGCQFEPEAISILFAYRTAAGRYGLAVAWAGFEGQSLQLIEEQGAGFRTLTEASRYWAPI